MAELLRFVDVGEYHEPDFAGPHVTDLREWTELVRRLSIPHYEEARLYWSRARSDGYFDGANEIIIYSEGFLKGMIEKYGEETD